MSIPQQDEWKRIQGRAGEQACIYPSGAFDARVYAQAVGGGHDHRYFQDGLEQLKKPPRKTADDLAKEARSRRITRIGDLDPSAIEDHDLDAPAFMVGGIFG